MSVKHTDEQVAILDFVKSGEGHLLIEALAGTGKTFTLIESLTYAPQKTAMLCAFNKKIATALEERMPKSPKGSVWKAQTFHSIGLSIVRSHFRVDVKEEATEDLVNDTIAAMKEEGEKITFSTRRAAVRLLRTLKEIHAERLVPLEMVLLDGMTYDCFGKLEEVNMKRAALVASMAYVKGYEEIRERGKIDFCDMTWLPVVLDLAPPSRYQIVFVDEAQDLSPPQLQLVQKIIASNGRLIVVGDRWQQIYKWRGSNAALVWDTMKALGASALPLTKTWRCATSIVEEANDLVPDLKPRDDAPPGIVESCTFDRLVGLLTSDPVRGIPTFLLSRTNADLLHTALYLWKAGVEFELNAGREIVQPLFEIIDNLDKSSKDRFRANVATWFQVEMAKAESIGAAAWADRIEQQYAMLTVLCDYADPKQFKRLLNDIIDPDKVSPLMLSTVHKAKGLEADRVFLLKQTFKRHKLKREYEMAMDDRERERALWKLQNTIEQEDLNIEYVAITRAKHQLVWVDMVGGVDVLTRILDLQTRDDREKDGAIGMLARTVFAARAEINGQDTSESRPARRRVRIIGEFEATETLDGRLVIHGDGDSIIIDPMTVLVEDV